MSNHGMNGDVTPIGKLIHQLMAEQGFNRDADLARAAGINASLLSRIDSSTPAIDTLRKLSAVLGVDLRELMVAADIATADELGLSSSRPPRQNRRTLHPGLAPINGVLADPGLAPDVKNSLVAAVRGAFDMWAGVHSATLRESGLRKPRTVT